MEDPRKPWPPRFPAAPPGTETRTLTDIEKEDWGPPGHDSRLVQTCHALRHKPVGGFSVEDLRILIGQGISLAVLIPLALERLKRDPLAEGDYFPGDLLKSVLQVDASFWRAHPVEGRAARQVAQDALSALDERARVAEGNVPGAGAVDAGGAAEVARRFLAG